MRVFGWAVLAVVCALSYANALYSGFVYDDIVNITQRASLRWTEASFANWLAAVADSPSKRPVTIATFGLQYAFGLDSPRAFHAINIVIHFLNGVLVAALAKLLLERAAALPNQAWRLPGSWLPYLSLAVALVFIAHPLQTQSVTYVVQRMNSLAATFHIFALLCFIWGRRSSSSGRRASFFFLALVSWVLGLGSKETAAVAPLAAWLYELYFERDLSWGFVRQSGALGLLVGVPTLIAAYVMLEMSGYQPFAFYPEKDFNAWERLLSQPRILVFYLSLAGWPLPGRLSLLHDFEVSRSLVTPATTLPSIVAIGLACVFAVGLARRHRLLSFGLVWFFLHLAIESSVLPLALAMEHRMYLPLFGLSLGAVVLAARVFEGRAQQGLAVLAVTVLFLGGATHTRNRVWLTPETLWRDVLEKYPDEFIASLNLGFDLAGQGRYAEALEQYRHADALKPGDTRVQTNLGTALAGLGRYEEAIPRLREALRIDSENPLAPAALGRALAIVGEHDEAVAYLQQTAERAGTPEAWIAHGNALLLSQRLMAARASYIRASRLAPSAAEPQTRLGIASAQLQDFERAIGHFERALSLSDGTDAELHSHLGLAYLGQGNEAKAIPHLERSLELAPTWAVGQNNLAWVLATAQDVSLRDGERALELARSSLQSSPTDTDFLSTTAAALAEVGRYSEAVQFASAAASYARSRNDVSLAAELESRAATYATASDAGVRSE